MSDRLAQFEGQLQSLRDERDGAAAESERLEAQLLEIDAGANDIAEGIRQSEAHNAANRERIATAESTIEHERNRGLDLEQEIARHRRQLAAMSTRAGDLQQQLQETTASLAAAEENHGHTAKRLVEMERGLTEVMAALDHLRGENEQRRAAYVQQMRLAAALGNETSALESQLSAAAAARQRCHDRIGELDHTLAALQQELDDLRRRRTEATEQVEQRAQWLAVAKDQLAQHQQRQAAAQNDLSELRQRHSAAAERAAVLDELVRRQEGLSAGVKEVLARAADPADTVFRGVHGLVADLFHVGVEAAPLVDIALGQAAQHVVATLSVELLKFLEAQSGRFGGRVGFLWLDGQPTVRDASSALEGRPGVLGRADRFVETESQFFPLARRLLGRTWFVEKLGQAVELARSVGGGLTFVTLSGELLEPDGTLVVGPRSASAGLISRRSQLRACERSLANCRRPSKSRRRRWPRLASRSRHNRSRSTGGRPNISRRPPRWPRTAWPSPPPRNAAASWTSSERRWRRSGKRPRPSTGRPCAAWPKPGKSENNSTRG